MRCVNPFRRYWYDSLTGERRSADCPCGKCVACLSNFQESWAIRAFESSKASRYVIYDTLTFHDAGCDWVDVSDVVDHQVLRPASYKILRRYYPDCYVPVADKSMISDWIKRGRELYNYHYRGKRPRLQLKYMIFEEYGPKSSRPHFHCLFFGIRLADYERFFGSRWGPQTGSRDVRFSARGGRKTYYFFRHGSSFSKTHSLSRDVSKDFDFISKYISKYCSKGVFESPLVKDGLQRKPFRKVSHGVGSEYLASSCFDWLKDPLLQDRLSLSDSYRLDIIGSLLFDVSSPAFDYYSAHLLRVPCDWREVFGDIDALRSDPVVSERVGERELSSLSRYVDHDGYIHALPRYYRNKLLQSSNHNVLNYQIQTLLLQDALERRYKEVSRLAASAQRRLPRGYGPTSSLEELPSREAALFCHWVVTTQRAAASLNSKRRAIELNNHYNRAKGAKYSFISS